MFNKIQYRSLYWRHILGLMLLLLAAAGSSGQVTADFSASLTSGCAPQLVKFTDNSTGNINSWSWDFGNGGTSILQNPSIIYTTAGTYTVKLTVSGPGGTNQRTRNSYIQIFDKPVAAFTVNTAAACQGSSFSFTNNSTPGSSGAAIVKYFWDMGDGDSAITRDVAHNYTIAGYKTVRLKITDANGCEAYKEINQASMVHPRPKVDFLADKTSSCVTPLPVSFTNLTTGNNLKYRWDLANGTSTSANPSTTYTTTGSYTVKLVATDSVTGCADSLIRTGYIQAGNFQVDFSPSTAQGCKNIPLTFNLNGTGTPQSVLWDFGDGNASNSVPGTNTYQNAGTYTVKLIVYMSGCTDTIIKNIVIDDEPIPSYTISPRRSCKVPFNVTFTNNSPSHQSFWDFGDGQTSNQRNITHTYTSQGPFIIKFTTITPGGCQVVKTDTFDFAPEIKITASPESTCGTSANVTFSYTSDPTGAVSQRWDFDDGNFSNAAGPTHLYNGEGLYIVKLTLTYPDGCQATGRDTVGVFSPPVPNFKANIRDTCVKKSISFTNLSQNYTKFQWDFGDGTIDSINVDPKHNYRNWAKILELPDSFNITLTLWNGTCQKDTIFPKYINIDPPLAWIKTQNDDGLFCDTPAYVNFYDVSRYENPRDTVTRLWSFNDPKAYTIGNQQCTTDTKNNINVGRNCNFSRDSLPVHIFRAVGDYNVKLWLYSARTRCIDSILYLVRVRTKFNVNYLAAPLSGCAPLKVDFNDTTKRSTGWFWDFGNTATDEDTDIVRKPSYTYTLPGKYNAVLLARDADGCGTTVAKQIDVRGPRASFTTNGKVCPPDSVQFLDISLKTDSLKTWHWKFGDASAAPGDTSNKRNPKYLFPQAGNYLVTLKVTDTLGCSSSITRVINYGPPRPEFKVVPDLVCLNTTVNMQNTTPGAFNNKYFWRFGDGDTSNLINPSHLYADTGHYDIQLIVRRNDGCRDSLTVPNAVQIVKPEFNFSVNKTQGLCPPFTAIFNYIGSDDIESWYWDFGDSSNSAISSPIHTYNKPGLYTVSLKVRSKGGCEDSLIRMDYIQVGGPVGTFTYSPLSGCSPLDVKFKASSNSALLYTWDFGDGQVDYVYSDSTSHIYKNNGVFRPALILTDSNNCSLTYYNSDSIQVKSAAIADFAPDISSVCVGGSISFTNLSAPKGAIAQNGWYVDMLKEANTENFTRLFTDTGQYFIRLHITDTMGCEQEKLDTISVVSQPDIEVSADTSVCTGTAAQLLVSGGVKYTWTPANTLDDDTLANPVANPNVTTVYTVTSKGQNGCPDISKNVTVTIMPLPPVDAGPQRQLCEYDSVRLQASGAASYVWEASPYLRDTLAADTWVFPPADTYFTVTGTGANGCKATDSVRVLVIHRPEPEIDGPLKVCPGAEITLKASGGDAFVWNTGTTGPELTTRIFNDISFWVESSQQGCLGGRDTIDITVDKAVLTADFTTSRDTFFTGEPVGITNNSIGASAYTWYARTGLDPYTDSIPVIIYRKDGSYQITLIVRSATGCTDSISRRIIILPGYVYFPNAFTPNGNGLNDGFGYTSAVPLTDVDFAIYNRWGEMIFHTNSPDTRWYGNYMDKAVAEGVYIYIFTARKFTGELIRAYGNITLLR